MGPYVGKPCNRQNVVIWLTPTMLRPIRRRARIGPSLPIEHTALGREAYGIPSLDSVRSDVSPLRTGVCTDL